MSGLPFHSAASTAMYAALVTSSTGCAASSDAWSQIMSVEWAEVENLREPAGSGRATWDEFDVGAAVSTVPESHMKRHRPQRVPLSTGALAALDELRGLNGVDGLAFRGPRGEKLGLTSVGNALRKAEINATWHGFRSSFKDWARQEGVDGLLSVFALAHVEG